MIIATLVGRAGIWSFISPRAFKQRPVPVGANLLLGAGIVLGSGAQMTPSDDRWVWVLWLNPVVICVFIAAVVLLGISRKTVVPDSGDR